MDPEIVDQLSAINRRFYTAQAGQFAETRRRIQPGVARILTRLPDETGAHWLDLGCGSGWLAVEWLRAGRTSLYTGVDFSLALLAEARRQVIENAADAADAADAAGVDFRTADFSMQGWETDLPAATCAGVLCFAVLHHLPGSANRAEFLRRAAGLLRAGGLLWFSVWQFQHSARLAARQIPWQRIGLSDAEVEPGDTLLDWRRTPDGVPALRYVHRFEPVELAGLAQDAGLSLLEMFESDGHGGRLGLYSGWVK